MAKQYFVKLGGQERLLKYGSLDRVALVKRFDRPFAKIFQDDIIANTTGEADLEAQVATLTLGLRRASGKPISEETVYGWVDDHLQAGGSIVELMSKVTRAITISGILGSSVDWDEMMQKFNENAPGEGDAAGKAAAASMEPSQS